MTAGVTSVEAAVIAVYSSIRSDIGSDSGRGDSSATTAANGDSSGSSNDSSCGNDGCAATDFRLLSAKRRGESRPSARVVHTAKGTITGGHSK